MLRHCLLPFLGCVVPRETMLKPQIDPHHLGCPDLCGVSSVTETVSSLHRLVPYPASPRKSCNINLSAPRRRDRRRQRCEDNSPDFDRSSSLQIYSFCVGRSENFEVNSPQQESPRTPPVDSDNTAAVPFHSNSQRACRLPQLRQGGCGSCASRKPWGTRVCSRSSKHRSLRAQQRRFANSKG